MKSVYLRKLFLTAVLSAPTCFLFVHLGGDNSFGSIVDAVYGGVFLQRNTNPVWALAFFWTPMVFAYMFSDFLRGELRERMPYVFCRTKERISWFVKKTIVLAGCAAVFCAMQLLILTANCLMAQIPMEGMAVRHIPMLLLSSLHILGLALSVSLLALKVDPAKGAVGLLSVHLSAGLAFLYGNLGKVAALFPVCHSIYFWHDVPGAMRFVPGFSVESSIAVFCVLILGLQVAGGAYVQKMDII